MKIKLVLFILTFISLNVFSQTTKTITIKPKVTSMGIIKGANNSYTLQTSTNGVLIGTQDSKVGRGYLEYDLTGKIPAGAKIESAEIVLIGKSAPSGNISNFGGKLRIERSNLTLTGANSSTWDALNTTFNSNDGGLNGVELQFNNASDIKVASGIPIMSVVAQPISNKATFVVKHISETSNYIYLDPLPSNAFNLNIVYSTKGSETPVQPNGGGTLSSNKSVLKSGESTTILYSEYMGSNDLAFPWRYNDINTSIYEAKDYLNIDSYSQTSIQISARKNLSSIYKIRVLHKKSTTSTNNSYLDLIIIGDAIIPKSNITETIIGTSTNISYTIPGLENIPGYTIQWTALENMTLVSGQGTAKPIFKTSSNGYGSVKATITYKGIKYETLTSKIWIGKPITPILEANSSKLNGILNSVNASVFNPNDDKITWSISGGTFHYKPTTYASAYPSGSANKLTITVTFTNVFGSSSSSVSYSKYLTDGPTKPTNGGGGLLNAERSVSSNTQEELSIKSIKIYNLSGVLVYSDKDVNENFDIRSTSLSNGIYIIEKYDGKNKSSQKVNLKR